VVSKGQQYYGLIASLPPLVRQGQEGFRTFNLANQFASLLDPSDAQALRLVYMPVDHSNILYKLVGSKNFVLHGNFDEDRIRQITEGEDLPYPYLNDFLNAETTLNRNVDRPALENRLFSLYHRYLLEQDNLLLRQWAWWQLRIREQTLRFLSQDAAIQSQTELETLDQTWPAGLFDADASDRTLPEDLQLILRNPDHLQRETDTDQWLWDQLENGLIFDPFSLDALISYALRQQISLRWSGFYGKNHSMVLEGILEDLLQEMTI
jgi:hypothetical protein